MYWRAMYSLKRNCSVQFPYYPPPTRQAPLSLSSIETVELAHIAGRSVQFSGSVVSDSLQREDSLHRNTPGLPVHHQLPESTQTRVHCVSDAIQTSHPLSSPSPPVLNLSRHQGLFKWVSCPHQVAKVLEFQPQHQSLQWTGVRYLSKGRENAVLWFWLYVSISPLDWHSILFPGPCTCMKLRKRRLEGSLTVESNDRTWQ